MIHFTQIPDCNNVAEICIGSTQIGILHAYNDYYEVSVCYYHFTVKRSLKRFIKPMIKTAYETNRYLLEAERLKLPIRINQSLDLIPEGKKNLTILA